MQMAVMSAEAHGVSPYPIRVEVDTLGGVYGYDLVGMAGPAVRESKHRIRSAMINAGFEFPRERVVVNLSPADRRKSGTALDLPIALAILARTRQVETSLADTLVLGELGLSGQVRPVRGVLVRLSEAVKWGLTRAIVPAQNAQEAASVEGLEVVAVASLLELVEVLTGQRPARPIPVPSGAALPRVDVDLMHVRGQALGRRALEVAALGGHNLLMVGPPGAGKTMLARALAGLLPIPDDTERLEVSRIYSVAGLLSGGGLVDRRPFRAPHHTASTAALIGGGAGLPRPGEVSLAHCGVLFLDELPEFRRDAREVLREPLESGQVVIARAGGNACFPARFQLVATMNPCMCGYRGFARTGRTCRCDPGQVERYARRLSGPLLDRIDLHVPVDVVAPDVLMEDTRAESTESVRARVMAGRERQAHRLRGTGFRCNSMVRGEALERLARLDGTSRRLATRMVETGRLSARGFHRMVRVARTVADLEGSELVQASHYAEAMQFREAM